MTPNNWRVRPKLNSTQGPEVRVLNFNEPSVSESEINRQNNGRKSQEVPQACRSAFVLSKTRLLNLNNSRGFPNAYLFIQLPRLCFYFIAMGVICVRNIL